MLIVDKIKGLIKSGEDVHLPYLGTINNVSLMTSRADSYSLFSKHRNNNLYKNIIQINSNSVIALKKSEELCFGSLLFGDLVDVVYDLHENNNKIMFIKSLVDGHHCSGVVKDLDVAFENIFSIDELKLIINRVIDKETEELDWCIDDIFFLEYPREGLNKTNINVYTLLEYINSYKDKIFITIERVWVGQCDGYGNNLANKIAEDPANLEWAYSDIYAQPPPSRNCGFARWRSNIPLVERKAIYFLSILKK